MHVDDALPLLEQWLGGPLSIDVDEGLVVIRSGGEQLTWDRRCDPPGVYDPAGTPVEGPPGEAVRAIAAYLAVAARFAVVELLRPAEVRARSCFVIECGEQLFGPPAASAPEAVALWRAVARARPDELATIRVVDPPPPR